MIHWGFELGVCLCCEHSAVCHVILMQVPVSSPSCGGDVEVCVWHKPTELAHSCWFCSCVCFCLYGPFSCISFHKFSGQLSAFSLCSSGLISASLVLSTVCINESLPQPWYNPSWLAGLKALTYLPLRTSVGGHMGLTPLNESQIVTRVLMLRDSKWSGMVLTLMIMNKAELHMTGKPRLLIKKWSS